MEVFKVIGVPPVIHFRWAFSTKSSLAIGVPRIDGNLCSPVHMRAHDQLGAQVIHGVPAEVDDGRPSPEKS